MIKSDLLSRQALSRIEEEIFKLLEEQKIDLVLTKKSDPSAFAQMVLNKGAVRLCRTKN